MRFSGWTIFSLAILVLGLAFWAWMGTAYDSWTDVGVYSVGITLILMGGVGTLVSLARPTNASP